LPADATAGLNSTTDVLALASDLARARIEQAEGHADRALQTLAAAVKREDALAYDEPADWFFPVRHTYGAALLQAKRAKEAEAVYREDLRRNPGNGWALFGLVQALRAQGRSADAKPVEAQFREAWKRADVAPTASAY
jgi:tetratricopeptide (TPR) repeat protein